MGIRDALARAFYPEKYELLINIIQKTESKELIWKELSVSPGNFGADYDVFCFHLSDHGSGYSLHVFEGHEIILSIFHHYILFKNLLRLLLQLVQKQVGPTGVDKLYKAMRQNK